MMNIRSVTVSSKGQITIPKEYREGYNLLEGEEAIMLPTEEGILIKHRTISLRGMLSGKIDLNGFESDVRALRKEWVQ